MRPQAARASASTLAAALLWVAPTSAAQVDASSAQVRGAEGALDNDAFLPTSTAAAEALARFDRARAELEARTFDEATQRAWSLALDELERALRESATGDGVAPLAVGTERTVVVALDVDGTLDPKLDRRREGVENAVRRRLAALPERARAQWTAVVGARGEERLARARRARADLAEVERNAPWTRAAAAAAIALADEALERAAPAEALAWLERASEHARNSRLEIAGISARESLAREELAALRGAERESTWSDARGLLFRGSIAVDELGQRVPRATLDPGLGVRPGLAFLENDRAVVHLPSSLAIGSERLDRLVLVDLAQSARVAVTTPLRLLEPFGVQPGSTERPVEPPGWLLEPASDGRAIVLTLGRRSYENDNVLACVEFVDNKGAAAPPELALRWAWHGGVCVTGDDAGREPLDWESCEFQPGLVVRDGAAFVLVREFTGGGRGDVEDETQARSASEIRSWLACFDLTSGALRWRTFLGKGGELQRSAGRFFNADMPTASGQALAECGELLFAGTHTGFGAMVERVDGRLAWSLKYRRRDPAQRAWTGARPSVGGGALAWAPADSDHLYWLRADAGREGTGLFVAAPRAHGEAEVLLGGDAKGAVVLSRVGAGRAAAAWDATSGGLALAPALGPKERFAGEGLVSPTRALFASDRGLYLLDRTRDLYLLDYAPLVPPLQGLPPAGGTVRARGEWICVLGTATLWVFGPRPDER